MSRGTRSLPSITPPELTHSLISGSCPHPSGKCTGIGESALTAFLCPQSSHLSSCPVKDPSPDTRSVGCLPQLLCSASLIMKDAIAFQCEQSVGDFPRL